MKSDDMSTSNEVAIRVLHKQRGTDSVWSLDQLEEKVLTMRDMYQRMEEEGRGVPMLVGLFVSACQINSLIPRLPAHGLGMRLSEFSPCYKFQLVALMGDFRMGSAT